MATTALATSAHAGVIQGSGWSFDSTTGVLEITGDIQYNDVNGYVSGDNLPGFSSSQMSSVTSIRFGEGVTYVEGFSYGTGYTYLQSVSFPSTLLGINSYAFDYSSLNSVTFDKDATGMTINGSAFRGCGHLNVLELPDNTSVFPDAFYGTNDLKIVLGDMSNASLSSGAFSGVGLVFCPDEACKIKVNSMTAYDTDNIKLYTKDSDGVYKDEDGVMYASAQDMIAGDTCGTHDACVTALGGNSGSGGSGGNVNNNSGSQSEPKRIYTLEEARQAVEAAGTETVNVRIRYK